MGFIGGTLKTLFSPLLHLIFSFFYGIMIRGPLELLNAEDKAFQYASGAEVDKLLFNTTLVDGKPHLNFFTSDSPLRYFFMLTLAVAGALMAIFLGLTLVHAFTRKPSSVFRKSGRAFLSGSLIFALPFCFLGVLSLVGSLISSISGSSITLSSQDALNYQAVLSAPIKKLKTMNVASFANKDQKLSTTCDQEGNPTTYSISEIYEHFNDYKKWGIAATSPLVTLTQANQSLFNDLVAKLSTSNSGKIELNQHLEQELDQVQTALDSIKPGAKDEDTSDQMKKIKEDLLDINLLIHNWQNNALKILKYGANTKTVANMSHSERCIYNFGQFYKLIWGNDDIKKPIKLYEIDNLYQYLAVTNNLLTGFVEHPNISLTHFSDSLSNYYDSPLVISFYQLVTGNDDHNWDRTFTSIKNGGVMVLIGFFIILAALVIFFLTILQAMSRIFSLALLFIMAPPVVVLSPLDDGERFKGWIKAVLGKMFAIIGIIVILRLFATLDAKFVAQINQSGHFKGHSGWLIKQIIIVGFSVGGLLAAYRGSQTISSIIGAGYGIQEGLQMGQAFRFMKMTGKGLKIAGKGSLGGLVTAGTLGSLNKERRQKLFSSYRKKLGSLGASAKQSSNNLLLAGANKMGSKRAGLKLATNKANAKTNKAKLAQEKLTSLKEQKLNDTKMSPSKWKFKKAIRKGIKSQNQQAKSDEQHQNAQNEYHQKIAPKWNKTINKAMEADWPANAETQDVQKFNDSLREMIITQNNDNQKEVAPQKEENKGKKQVTKTDKERRKIKQSENAGSKPTPKPKDNKRNQIKTKGEKK